MMVHLGSILGAILQQGGCKFGKLLCVLRVGPDTEAKARTPQNNSPELSPEYLQFNMAP